MKSFGTYHLTTIVPIAVILGLYIYDLMSIQWFVFFIVLYSFLYRPWIDYMRLLALGLIQPKDWKKFIGLGLIRFKFYNELMFKSNETKEH